MGTLCCVPVVGTSLPWDHGRDCTGLGTHRDHVVNISTVTVAGWGLGLGTWFIGGFVRDREAFEESVAAMWTVLIVTAKYGRIKCQSDRHTVIH